MRISTASVHCRTLLFLFTSILCGCGPSGRDLSDAQWLGMQQDLQAERAEVGHQRDLLEDDRRQWSERERSEPILAAVISSSVLLICCVLPVVLVGVLLWPRRSDTGDDAVCELVMDEMVTAIESANHQSAPNADHDSRDRLTSRKS
ncbi:membrane or secreted protein [Allorhodopirellula solitaria]|uniref:Lipoprotein n=1 Tax=Allorhodopirellula solitaria TaxID=2527987 RepID=A0A5C5X162_9BACT|nr:membrane or secreted protein [Allorhodopirellula solitaria]TWT56540.1 hypothetical protein CA85_40730 [Allorhodopirellula solitaria]